jgi:hypothetical protein
MAKFKLAGSRKTPASNSKRGLIPCLFLVALGLAIVFLLLYGMLSSSK